uniref:Phage tail assembly chaperone-like domain-containing protein n=1 Tax=Dulem virus 29 TaxID=3145747 RepID=A0AAU8B2E3_9CAUD
MFCYRYDDEGYFTERAKCQVDPLESKKRGQIIYLMPKNSTTQKPFEEKEGYKIKYVDGRWVYEKINKEIGKIEEPVEEKQAHIRSVRNGKLNNTDFTQLPDAPLDEKEIELYRLYREYLRHYPESENWYENKPLTFEEWSKNNELV